MINAKYFYPLKLNGIHIKIVRKIFLYKVEVKNILIYYLLLLDLIIAQNRGRNIYLPINVEVKNILIHYYYYY